ncbi:energy-coupling factor transporter transmembrane protein EcfT [Rhodococcus sp. IEGM 1401]|uniref:energy-coupling factor transporter transmembrane component T family protein n=1 Tax=unclassified Rhodococcus (in: high G+C Gram-positive bacteria) TaxID=192944 RepID=UPI0022B5573F|nr:MULTISPECIES: energy-coupling factor transporter transmembrane protein EcfT [unclassified Rhodococcus (in: high G+C Gram-positive bacteria)]MCZ4562025.1 energy-coupling factor transporter transmembrane protein EcfT [Rhodococcus sp. IEGM 1401]MDI9922067.1 energy-coupling factor transporter transmembrane protein EcfT [Rhodococcus sp. IEGM 1372]MDI9927642.1 energy-coupling factor transporter transmembrane protein EcfT [Rhodococcus sp. IEGM 1341]MDV8034620.1 energy-coupling factor transporter tr
MIGLYRPGTSLLHRMSPGSKLLALILAILGTVIFARTPLEVAAVAVLVAALFAVARIPAKVALAQLRPVLWMLLIIGVFQVIITTWQRAVVVCGVLVISVALAALVTLTTRVTDMLDTVTRALGPVRRFGVDPDRIGLLLALAIRCIPLLASIVQEVSQARKARGLQWSMTALATPVLVRALRTADAMGDALVARGVDDDGDDDE